MSLLIHPTLHAQRAQTTTSCDPFSALGGPMVAKSQALAFWEGLRHHHVISPELWDQITDYLIIPANQIGESRRREILTDSATVSLPQALAAISVTSQGRTFLTGCLPRIAPFIPLNAEALTLSFNPYDHSGLLTHDHLAMRRVHDLIAGLERLSYSQLLRWFDSSLQVNGPHSDQIRAQLHSELPKEFSLISFNVGALPGLCGYGLPDNGRFSQIGGDLRREDASFVLLQEMWRKEADVIRQRAGYEHVAQGGLVRSSSPGNYGLLGKSGLMILSKFPLTHVEEIPFPNPKGVEKLFVKKGILFARAQIPGFGYVDLFDVHTQSCYPGFLRTIFPCDEEGSRRAQLEFIREQVARRREPHVALSIVAGDFNVLEGSEAYHSLLKQIGADVYRDRHPFHELSEPHLADRVNGYTFDPYNNPLAALTQHPEDAPSRLDYGIASGTLAERGKLAFHGEVLFNGPQYTSDHAAARFRISGS
jgi:endonuclease/exonuclease/phosphatase family metal-dependent hydrolase